MDDTRTKRLGRAIDLTTGKPLKSILLFMLPMILGNFVQQLYSLVDTVIVGQALGAAALTGVGSTGAISFMILGFVSGLSSGFSVIVSQRRGADDEEGMRRSFATGIVLTLGIVAVLTVVAVFVAEPMLVAMNTKPEFLPYALDYIRVIFGGMLLSAFSNLFGSTLRALGDSRVPLYFLIASCFLNAGMDSLFVIGLGMGVDGAALATILANGLVAAATFVYLWVRYPVLRFSPRHFKPEFKNYGAHLKLALPMALQLSIVSIGMIFGQSALNTMEPVAVTGYVAATKIDGIATGIINNGGAAISIYVGQNYGAKRYDRIKSGVKQFTVFSVCLCLGLGAVVLALNRPLVMLFISRADRSQALYDSALKYLIFNACFYILLATLCIARGALQGMGRGVPTLVVAATEVVMRVCVSIIAIRFASYTVVCMSNCISWIGANIVIVPAFLIVLKKYVPFFGVAPIAAADIAPELSVSEEEKQDTSEQPVHGEEALEPHDTAASGTDGES